jgi:hypothetical protein
MELRSASRRLVLLVPRWPSPSWRSFIRSPAAHYHSPPLKPLGQQVDGQGDEPCQGNLYDMEPHEPSPLLYAFSHAAGPSVFSLSSSAPTRRLPVSPQGTPCATRKGSRQGRKKPSPPANSGQQAWDASTRPPWPVSRQCSHDPCADVLTSSWRWWERKGRLWQKHPAGRLSTHHPQYVAPPGRPPAANAPLHFLRRSLGSSQNRDVELADIVSSEPVTLDVHGAYGTARPSGKDGRS